MNAPDPVKFSKYPRDVRALVNWCRAMLLRPKSIIYTDDLIPRWNDNDDLERIVLPRQAPGGTIRIAVSLSGTLEYYDIPAKDAGPV